MSRSSVASQQLLHFSIVNGGSTLACIAAIVYLPWYWTGKCEILLLILMWIITGNFGISVGYHRLFTHRSFEAKHWLRTALAIAGATAGQGPVTYWVAVHRAHHMHSDSEGDPHSPISREKSKLEKLKAFCYGHFVWAFQHDVPSRRKYAPDLLKDRAIRQIEALYPLWLTMGLVIPALLGGLITQSWKGMLGGFLWGGCIRLTVVNHLIWSINSVGHLFGHQEHETGDNSRNNLLLATLTFGEGWHNTHHAHPHAANFTMKWWHIDIGYYSILLLHFLGLAWNVKRTV